MEREVHAVASHTGESRGVTLPAKDSGKNDENSPRLTGESRAALRRLSTNEAHPLRFVA